MHATLIIDVKVTDLKRAVEFYQNILGLPVRHQEKEWAAIHIGDAEIHLYLQSGTTGHVELYVSDITHEVQRLHSLGIRFISGKQKPHAVSVDESNITTFPWGKAAFFHDSEGNELALVQDFATI